MNFVGLSPLKGEFRTENSSLYDKTLCTVGFERVLRRNLLNTAFGKTNTKDTRVKTDKG